MATFNNPRHTAATATASATLVRGYHTPVDATVGPLTMTLPGNAPVGVEVSVEKVDSSANAVTVSGTMRGVPSTIPLTSQYEARTFLSDGSGSWRPTSDHRTTTSLSATISAQVGASLAANPAPANAAAAAIDSAAATGGMKRTALQNDTALNGLVTVTNYHPNPGAEVNAGGMVGSDGTVTATRSTAWFETGAYCWAGTYSNTAGAWLQTDLLPLNGATSVYTRVRARNASSAIRLLRFRTAWYDGAGGFVGAGGESGGNTDPGANREITNTDTPPAGATQMRIQLRRDSGVAGDIVQGDGFLIFLNPPATPPTAPFDGDQPLTYWSGLPGQSSSVRVTSPPTTAQIAAYTDSATKSLTSTIAGWGDSLSATTYEATLATMTGSAVYSGGVSGQESGPIAVRQGGVTITTTASATIPTSGAVSIPVQASAIPFGTRSNVQILTGSLAGVPGTFMHTANSTLTGVGTVSFTRNTSGSTLTVPSGTPFVVTEGDPYRDKAAIFWTGRNDAAFIAPDHATAVLAATKAMVAHLTPTIGRFLVVSVTTATNEPSGSNGYIRVLQINAALQAAFPTQYVDLRRHLIDNGLSILGLTPNSTDLAAIAADTLPPSLNAPGDTVHPTATAQQQVIAPFLKNQLALRGWV